VFSRAYRHVGGEKIEKKLFPKSFQKVEGSPWIHPMSFEKLLQNSGFSIGRI
jgi:hypothetical protein